MPTTELISAQGVWDAELMFFVATDTVDDDIVSSLLILGTPAAGLAVRLYMPTQPATADNVLTVTIHGSLTEDGANIEGGMVYTKEFDEDIWDDVDYVETIIPFTLPSYTPWVVMTIDQSDATPDDITGLIAGIVTDYKAVDWSRQPGWIAAATVP